MREFDEVLVKTPSQVGLAFEAKSSLTPFFGAPYEVLNHHVCAKDR